MVTKAELLHMGRVAALGCIACKNMGINDSPAELHHPRMRNGLSRRASNFDVIPLCPIHHRTGGIGVAFHAGKRTWEAKYGTESELLEQTRREMERAA